MCRAAYYSLVAYYSLLLAAYYSLTAYYSLLLAAYYSFTDVVDAALHSRRAYQLVAYQAYQLISLT